MFTVEGELLLLAQADEHHALGSKLAVAVENRRGLASPFEIAQLDHVTDGATERRVEGFGRLVVCGLVGQNADDQHVRLALGQIDRPRFDVYRDDLLHS